jgi:hypothetical protein
VDFSARKENVQNEAFPNTFIPLLWPLNPTTDTRKLTATKRMHSVIILAHSLLLKSLKKRKPYGINVLIIKCTFHFPLQLFLMTFFVLMNMWWITLETCTETRGLHVKKCVLLLPAFNQNWNGLLHLTRALQYQISKQSAYCYSSCYIWTDMARLIETFFAAFHCKHAISSLCNVSKHIFWAQIWS